MPTYQEKTTLTSAEQVDTASERQVIERILASDHFNKSPLLSAFLSYVCTRILDEGVSRITELEIGIDVFRRAEDYDPHEDNIVRNYARQLRRRLDDYYREEGLGEILRVSMPKGGYVPVFAAQERGPKATQADRLISSESIHTPVLQTHGEPVEPTITSTKGRWLWLSILCVVLTITAFVVWHRTYKTKVTVSHDPLWNEIFEPSQPTTWVSPDSGLVLLNVATHTETTLAEYMRRDFSRQLKALSPEERRRDLAMAERRYTSFAEVEMVHRFDVQTSIDRSDFHIAFARDIRLNEIKQGNIILLGSHFSNPWVELFEPRMNFVGVIDYETKGVRFENRHPKPGEPASYNILWSDSARKLLGSVAYLPGLEGKGHTLIIEGSSEAAGEAVEDYLLNDAEVLPFLQSIRRSDGTLPSFELLFESTNIDGTAGPCHIIASRVYSGG